MQNSGAIQNADPSLQAAYVARLQQQASQIKNLLKLLNSSGVNKSSNDANDSNGYESLWEVGLARNIRDDLIPEVEEGGATIEADESQDVNHEDIYENTGVFPHNFSLSVGEFLWVSRRQLFRGCRVIPSCTMLCDTMQIFWKTVVSCNIALTVDSYVWAVWSNCDQKFTGYKGSQFDSVERLSDEIWPRLAPAPTLQVVATCLHLNFPTSSSSGPLGFLPESVQSAARLWPAWPGPLHLQATAAQLTAGRSIISVTALGVSFTTEIISWSSESSSSSVSSSIDWQRLCSKISGCDDSLLALCESEVSLNNLRQDELSCDFQWWHFDEYCRTSPATTAQTASFQTRLGPPGRISPTKWESQDWPAGDLLHPLLLQLLPGSSDCPRHLHPQGGQRERQGEDSGTSGQEVRLACQECAW